MHIPDLINGLFEAGSSVFSWMSVARLRRDKTVKGFYWPGAAFFTGWGLWNLYYYPSLSQWFSWWGGLGITLANGVWVAMVIRLVWASRQQRPADAMPITDRIGTDSLGFPLRVEIYYGPLSDPKTRGQHVTYEVEGKVMPDATHKIQISNEMKGSELAEVIAHEVYHLFGSVKHLVTCDEESEATTYGQLVRHIHSLIASRPQKRSRCCDKPVKRYRVGYVCDGCNSTCFVLDL